MATKNYHLEDKVSGPYMDLSLEQIVDVPIREMALHRHVTTLDLGNNLIRILPDDIPEVMSQLQTLDLSRNLLIGLPETFGALTQLRRLDLYRNKIERLPTSFSRLDELLWLDIKENPLVASLAKIAGDCLDNSQCGQAAKNLVHYMRQVEQQCVIEKSNGKKFQEPVLPQTPSSDPTPPSFQMTPRPHTDIHDGNRESATNTVPTHTTNVATETSESLSAIFKSSN